MEFSQAGQYHDDANDHLNTVKLMKTKTTHNFFIAVVEGAVKGEVEYVVASLSRETVDKDIPDNVFDRGSILADSEWHLSVTKAVTAKADSEEAKNYAAFLERRAARLKALEPPPGPAPPPTLMMRFTAWIEGLCRRLIVKAARRHLSSRCAIVNYSA